MRKNKKAKVLIPVGFGLNCQEETAHAFRESGADIVDKIHVNEIIKNPSNIENYNILAFIRGFSFGDHISAGKVLANKFKYKLKKQLENFIEENKLIIGICNGFQVLVKLGLLPAIKGSFIQEATLTENKCEHFYDGWVNLKVNKNSKTVFTRNLEKIELPVRHGEGRIVFKNKKILDKLIYNEQIVLHYLDEDDNITTEYPYNPNGSVRGIAGICDTTGKVFGLMPHPEAYIDFYTHPNWRNKPKKKYGDGYFIFKNCVDYFKKN